MNKMMLLAGIAVLATSVPAMAKKDQGHGNGNHAAMKNGKGNHAVRGGRDIVLADRRGRYYALDGRGRCPPGLAKKGNGCQPPGQAKKLYSVGQRYNRNFGTTWTYNQIPDRLRSQYGLDRDARYYYNSGYLYQVDPRTMLIQQVVSALLR